MTELPTQQGGQPLKYTLTHYRKPEHTHEAFIKWVVEEHLPLAIPVFKKHGIIEYSLVSNQFSAEFEMAQNVLMSQLVCHAART